MERATMLMWYLASAMRQAPASPLENRCDMENNDAKEEECTPSRMDFTTCFVTEVFWQADSLIKFRNNFLIYYTEDTVVVPVLNSPTVSRQSYI